MHSLRRFETQQTTTTVAHKIYGVPQTINSANYVYFLAYQELFSLIPAKRAESNDATAQAGRLISEKDLERVVTGQPHMFIYATEQALIIA